MTDPRQAPAEIEIRMTDIPINEMVDARHQKVLITTTANVQLALHEAWGRIRPRNDWATPLGIGIAIVVAIMTTDFVKRFNVDANVWTAIFWVIAILCGLWFVVAFWQRLKIRALDPKGVVDLLKQDGLAISKRLEPTGSADAGAKPEADQAGNHQVSTYPGSAERRGQSGPTRSVGTRNAPESSASPVQNGNLPTGAKFVPGMRVRHRSFGEGVVVGTRQVNDKHLVQVDFDDRDVRSKELRADIAPLEVLDDGE